MVKRTNPNRATLGAVVHLKREHPECRLKNVQTVRPNTATNLGAHITKSILWLFWIFSYMTVHRYSHRRTLLNNGK